MISPPIADVVAWLGNAVRDAPLAESVIYEMAAKRGLTRADIDRAAHVLDVQTYFDAWRWYWLWPSSTLAVNGAYESPRTCAQPPPGRVA